MVVLGTLVFILALIYGVLVRWVGPDEQGLFFFNTLLASAAIVILIRAAARRASRRRSAAGCSRRSSSSSRRIEMLRAELANVIDMRVLVPRVLAALEDSRRITHAVDLPGRSRRVGLRAGRTRRPAPGGALRRRSRTARSSSACAARASSPSRASSASWRRAARRRTRSRRASAHRCATLDADERLGGARVLQRGSAARACCVMRDERLREAYSSDEIELFRGVATQHRHHAAELAGLRAHEGARSSRGARPDGGRPRARDPQPARLDQGRRPVPAADGQTAARPTRRGHARVPRHHRRGGEPPQQDRLAVPRLRAPLPRRAAAARGHRGAAQDAGAVRQGGGGARQGRDRDRPRRRACRPCAPTPSSSCRCS